MREVSIYEDDIICSVKNYLQQIDYFVLVSSASQTKYFFELDNRKRKCPDIIAIKDNILLVIEAKIKANDIFRIDYRGYSDYSCLSHVISRCDIKEKFIYKISEKLKSMGIINDNYELYTCVLANESFKKYNHKLINDEIGVISTDYINNKIYIENDIYSILK